jgi:autotransporter-associated beta strand protein
MKTTFVLRRFLLASSLLAAANSAHGQSTWNPTGGGTWNNAVNWTGGIPDSSTASATFSKNFTGSPIVTLDNAAGFTINQITYDDTGASGDSTLAINAGTGGKLILAGTTPTINTSSPLSISVALEGTTGLRKSGSGTLSLSGTNTYTGVTTIALGTVNVSGDHSAADGGWSFQDTGGTVNFQSGSTIAVRAGANITMLNGGTAKTLNVAGTVTTGSTSPLNVRGASTLALNSGASWTQNGSMTIQSQASGTSAVMSVNTGANFTYTNTANIVLARATSSGNGSATLNLSGGTFTTTRGISNTAAGSGSGSTNLNFSNGGTLKISNNITSLIIQGTTAFNVATTSAAGGIIDTNSFNTAIGVGISGAGGMTKASAGTLTLSGGNSYTGTTTISGGTLQLGNGGTTGALTGTTGILNNGNLTVNRSNAFTQAINLNGQAITGSGSFTQAGSGTTTLSSANTYTGATAVDNGTLVVGGGSLANTAITVNNSGSAFAVRPGSGTINLGKTDAGTAGATLTLASGTSFSMMDGDTGTANLQQQVSFASSGLTLSGGASLNFDVGATLADKLAVTKGATVSGTNSINVMGLGSMAGSYDLVTAASGLDGGTYTFGGSGTSSQTLAMGTNAYALTLGISATAVTLSVASTTSISGVTWTGQTNGNGAGNSIWDNAFSTNWAANTTASAVGNGTAVTFGDTNAANGDAAITNSTVTVAPSGVSPTSANFNNSAVNYTVGGGSIGGTGTLTKTGTATVTLTGANTYTGATLVSAGTLLVNGSLGNTAVTVDPLATIGGIGAIGGDLSIAGNSLFEVVDINDPLAVSGTINFGSGFGIANLLGIDWDSLDLNIPYTLISTIQTFGTGDIANFGLANAVNVGTTGRQAYFASGSLNVFVIPEPSAALLGGLGLIALVRRRRVA